MKTYSIIFGLIGYILLIVAIATANIYILALAELITIPSILLLLIFKDNSNATNY